MGTPKIVKYPYQVRTNTRYGYGTCMVGTDRTNDRTNDCMEKIYCRLKNLLKYFDILLYFNYRVNRFISPVT
jgi:hypothetical protein